MSFLVVGLLPSVLYGGYSGLILGYALFGGPIHESALAQTTAILGMLFGVLAVGAMFMLSGAILATGIYGTLFTMATSSARIEEPARETRPASPGRASGDARTSRVRLDASRTGLRPALSRHADFI